MRETLVSGSTSGTCPTPQQSDNLRALGNQRIVRADMGSRNLSIVYNRLTDGETTGTRVRREARCTVTDPANRATYTVASWANVTASTAPFSVKLLSPRIMRDTPEMLGKRGNALYADSDNFRICGSDSNFVTADAATANCTQFGVGGDSWGSHANGPYTPEKLTEGDRIFASMGFADNTSVTFQIYADDGWKTVNGQADKTPIATYQVTLTHAPYTLTEMASSPAAYPTFVSSSLT
ncbi:MAG: hypothetical protein ACTS8S_09385, partial [Giesbergeria sp.]